MVGRYVSIVAENFLDRKIEWSERQAKFKHVRRSRCQDVFKMPRMGKAEYDRLVEEQYVCRIAFKGEKHPYIAPFLYVFDGRFMYFLSTNYGKKVQYFLDNPFVTVEIEHYSPDLSAFSFVALPGRLVQVEDAGQKRAGAREVCAFDKEQSSLLQCPLRSRPLPGRAGGSLAGRERIALSGSWWESSST